MRDVTTVARGETVHLRSDLVLLDTGSFVGLVDDKIVVDLGHGIANVPLDSNITVEDIHGQVIGVLVDEPILTGLPPELE